VPVAQLVSYGVSASNEILVFDRYLTRPQLPPESSSQ
jgi:hypothetical protein